MLLGRWRHVADAGEKRDAYEVSVGERAERPQRRIITVNERKILKLILKKQGFGIDISGSGL
jgi:hypothetical protein